MPSLSFVKGPIGDKLRPPSSPTILGAALYFTITVHTKKTCSKEDEVLQVGKLNLVDLAGSERLVPL